MLSPWPLAHFLLSGAFPPALRVARGRTLLRRFAFPLPVYSVLNQTQLATKSLHVPLSLVLAYFFYWCFVV